MAGTTYSLGSDGRGSVVVGGVTSLVDVGRWGANGNTRGDGRGVLGAGGVVNAKVTMSDADVDAAAMITGTGTETGVSAVEATAGATTTSSKTGAVGRGVDGGFRVWGLVGGAMIVLVVGGTVGGI